MTLIIRISVRSEVTSRNVTHCCSELSIVYVFSTLLQHCPSIREKAILSYISEEIMHCWKIVSKSLMSSNLTTPNSRLHNLVKLHNWLYSCFVKWWASQKVPFFQTCQLEEGSASALQSQFSAKTISQLLKVVVV